MSNLDNFCDNHIKKVKQYIKNFKKLIPFERSFASYYKSHYWSIENEISCRDIFKSSNQKFKFNCNNCSHELEIRLNHVSKGSWCCYCSNPPQKLCDEINCNLCFDKSFASHDLSKYWSNKNLKSSRKIFKHSNNKFEFDCNICNHTFKIMLCHLNKGQWCCYCSNQKLCDNENCNLCFNKSFASSDKSKYWSDKNNKLPRDVFLNANTKYIFDCNECNNDYISQLNDISYRDRWCNCKFNKTETKLFNWLNNKFNKYIIVKQFKIDKYNYKYDFYIKDLSLIIELDGRQHFIQVSNWESPEFNLQNDIDKINLSITNNYSIIHILQDDVCNDKNNWEDKLISCIKEYNKTKIIFINNNNLYKNHINELNNCDYDIIIV